MVSALKVYHVRRPYAYPTTGNLQIEFPARLPGLSLGPFCTLNFAQPLSRVDSTLPKQQTRFPLSFFLSLVSKTQPNHWTKRMPNTRLAT